MASRRSSSVGHVGDRVVDEHGVEAPAEPDRPHVPLDVLALGVELPADLEHAVRQVDQGELKWALRWEALLPPPEPSSSTVRGPVPAVASSRR
jgi:hypothetical protein